MSTPKIPPERADKLATRTVQITGFGFAGVLLIVRVIASVFGKDAGISEFLIGGFAGIGVTGTIEAWRKR